MSTKEKTKLSSELLKAARKLDVQSAQRLLNEGADVNIKDSDGNTPFMIAARHFSPTGPSTQEIASEMLKDLEGDKNKLPDERRVSAKLVLKYIAANQEFFRILYDAGADIQVKNKRGEKAADLVQHDSMRAFITGLGHTKSEQSDIESSQKKSGCFIATAAYGNKDHSVVIAYKDFRDTVLKSSYLGRLFIRFYYQNSPYIANKIRKHRALRTISTFFLEKLAFILKRFGEAKPSSQTAYNNLGGIMGIFDRLFEKKQNATSKTKKQSKINEGEENRFTTKNDNINLGRIDEQFIKKKLANIKNFNDFSTFITRIVPKFPEATKEEAVPQIKAAKDDGLILRKTSDYDTYCRLIKELFDLLFEEKILFATTPSTDIKLSKVHLNFYENGVLFTRPVYTWIGSGSFQEGALSFLTFRYQNNYYFIVSRKEWVLGGRMAGDEKEKVEVDDRENNEEGYYVIKMYPVVSNPELDFLTNGWTPVVQIMGNEAAICIFFEKAKAEDYKSKYYKMAAGQVRSLEIEELSNSQIKKLQLISPKMTSVAINPTLQSGQFGAEQIQRIDAF